jgi:hypothetical protein
VPAYSGNFEPGYLCYRRIYSPSVPGRAGDLIGPVPAGDCLLRCVSFHSEIAARNDKAFNGWMHNMLTRYRLVETASHEMCDQVRSWYDVYYFRPRSIADGQSAINVIDPRSPEKR